MERQKRNRPMGIGRRRTAQYNSATGIATGKNSQNFFPEQRPHRTGSGEFPRLLSQPRHEKLAGSIFSTLDVNGNEYREAECASLSHMK
jgi:hypothetical protein